MALVSATSGLGGSRAGCPGEGYTYRRASLREGFGKGSALSSKGKLFAVALTGSLC